MARMGVRKLTALITRIIDHSFGVLPTAPQAEDLRKDADLLSSRGRRPGHGRAGLTNGDWRRTARLVYPDR